MCFWVWLDLKQNCHGRSTVVVKSMCKPCRYKVQNAFATGIHRRLNIQFLWRILWCIQIVLRINEPLMWGDTWLYIVVANLVVVGKWWGGKEIARPFYCLCSVWVSQPVAWRSFRAAQLILSVLHVAAVCFQEVSLRVFLVESRENWRRCQIVIEQFMAAESNSIHGLRSSFSSIATCSECVLCMLRCLGGRRMRCLYQPDLPGFCRDNLAGERSCDGRHITAQTKCR